MAMRAGCEVVAPDFPGYGLTVRNPRTKPSYALWSTLGSALINAERQRDGLPVFVWGLSIGGLLAYMAVAENGKAAGCIATTLADTRKIGTMAKVGRNPLLGGGGYLLAKALGPIIDSIKLPMKWFSPMELISDDPDISKVFMQDRLAGGTMVSMGFLRSLMNVKPALEPENFDLCPILLVHPQVDPWTPLELSNVNTGLKVPFWGCGHFPSYDFP